MSDVVQPESIVGDQVLVRCPKCDSRAVIDDRSGSSRITCGSCGYMQETEPKTRGVYVPYLGYPRYSWSAGPSPLWLETECCGGEVLWALNQQHLDYLEAFVRSTDRTRQFPSVPGNRQPADKLPTWIKTRKNRDEVLRAIGRLRAKLT